MRNILFLNKPELINQYWDQVEPLLETVVQHACRGEFTLEDIKDRLDSSDALCGIVMSESVELAFVFEMVYYPRKTVARMMALGGKDLNFTMSTFLPTFRKWAIESGISEIEGCTSLAMTRLLKPMGFEHIYDVVRLRC